MISTYRQPAMEMIASETIYDLAIGDMDQVIL